MGNGKGKLRETRRKRPARRRPVRTAAEEFLEMERQSPWMGKRRDAPGCKPTERERFEATLNGLLSFVNMYFCLCPGFTPPIDNDYTALQAMRLLLEFGDNEDLANLFAFEELPLYPDADFQLADTWRDCLVGPMVCMETAGDHALVLCEGHVFDVRSLGRPWDSLVPYAPDMVTMGLFPFDDSIVGSGLLLRHFGPMMGEGVSRIREEFEAGKRAGIVSDVEQFSIASNQIKELWCDEGLDPTSYAVLTQAADEVNDILAGICKPYVPYNGMRPWP